MLPRPARQQQSRRRRRLPIFPSLLLLLVGTTATMTLLLQARGAAAAAAVAAARTAHRGGRHAAAATRGRCRMAGFLRPVTARPHSAAPVRQLALVGASPASTSSTTASSSSRHGRRAPYPLPFRRRGGPLAAAVSTSTSTSNPSSTTIAGATAAQRAAALGQVRAELAKRGMDAFIVPSGDPHLSEYPAVHFWRRAFVSGFDGSAGTAVVVTAGKALLWTDGRYHLQAEQQLGPDWELMREGQKDVPSIAAYLKETLAPNSVVGIDPTVHPAKFVRALAKALAAKHIRVRPLGPNEANPIDEAWAAHGARPPAPQAPVRVHPLAYAGETVASKVSRLAGEMAKEGADVLVAGTLDEVAWLLNVRGDDIPNCPLAVAYAVLEREGAARGGGGGGPRAVVFVEAGKLGAEARKHLVDDCGVEIRPYGEIFAYLSQAVAEGKRVWLDPDKSNYALVQAASGARGQDVEVASNGEGGSSSGSSSDDKASLSLISKPSPVTLWKALKNPVELEGMRAAHLRDGAAEVEFLAWLDKEVQARAVSELEIDEVLTGLRARREKFLGLSFDTIAGVGPNGAIIHYRATPESNGAMTRETMLLLDSGAQYADGTTDVTRTVHFGAPTEAQREAFTRVLQGHIGIDTAVFPEGTPGFVLDAYARRALWQAGLDYAHGTGHGVGAALNVHEGPQGISFNFANQTPLQPGMVLSNEPGYYAAGQWGIRIENLLVVVEKQGLGGEGRDPRKRKFLGFERLTHIPISKRLVKRELLAPEEVRWLDDYHAEVWAKVGPLLQSEEARAWLREATSPLA